MRPPALGLPREDLLTETGGLIKSLSNHYLFIKHFTTLANIIRYDLVGRLAVIGSKLVRDDLNYRNATLKPKHNSHAAAC